MNIEISTSLLSETYEEIHDVKYMISIDRKQARSILCDRLLWHPPQKQSERGIAGKMEQLVAVRHGGYCAVSIHELLGGVL